MPSVETPLPLTVGHELEVESLSDRCAERDSATYRVGAPISAIPGWVLKTDMSCGPDPVHRENGYELVSRVMKTEEQLNHDVRAAVAYAKRYRAKINERCGFHLHVGGIRDYPLQDVCRLLSFLVRYESGFFALAQMHRQTNPYCRKLEHDLCERVRAGRGFDSWTTTERTYHEVHSGADRYCWLNGASSWKHGTLEFRLQEGTLNETDILGWTDFVLFVCYSVLNLRGKVFSRKTKTDAPGLVLHDLLQRAGFYGKASQVMSPAMGLRAIRARHWAAARFKSIHGYSHRMGPTPVLKPQPLRRATPDIFGDMA